MTRVAALCLLMATAVFAVDEVVVIELEEESMKLEPSETLYNSIFLKFDPECLEHKDMNIQEYFQTALTNAKQADLDETASVQEGREFNEATSALQLPDADQFSQLMQDHLHTAHAIIGGTALQPKTGVRGLGGRQLGVRRLGDLGQDDREEEVLSALHLLAASQLVGVANVPQVLTLEKAGKWRDALTFIQNSTATSLPDAEVAAALAALERRHAAADAQRLSSNRDGDQRAFQDEHEWMTHQARPVVTDSERLHALDLRIIHNPLLRERLIKLASILPCVAFPPEADRTKQTLGKLRVVGKGRQLNPGRVQTMPVQPAPTRYMREQSMFTGDKDEGVFELDAPNDAFFGNQWYLKGSRQGEKFGSHVIDGWSTLLRDLSDGSSKNTTKKTSSDNSTATHSKTSSDSASLKFTDLAKVAYGMDIAVLDSGCSRNPDLVNQFWFNEEESECAAAAGQADFLGDDVDKLRGNCVGYDFGNDSPDPTKEEGKIHGSSTSGLVAAEGNNNIGITGVCPHCRVMCLKIYDASTKKITLTSVVRALNYVAEKKIKLSNHSYGGFGASNVEYTAHEALNKLGHLTVASSGNNGCNIDHHPGDDPNACVNESGDSLGLFTPAGYDLPNILSVGGTTQTGQLAWFSNYGKELVDVFAPGSDIITIYGASQMASVKGTSFSSPIVTGIAGVLWSYRPELSAREVKELLMETGTAVDGLKDKAKSPRIVSLARALGEDSVTTILPASADSRVNVEASFRTLGSVAFTLFSTLALWLWAS